MLCQIARSANDLPCRDYAVRVRGLPRDASHTEIEKYFSSRWGNVARVDLAHSCYSFIDLVNDRAKLVEKEETAVARLQREAEMSSDVSESLETNVLRLRYDLILVTR